jgi:hypothetical protein
VTHQVEVMAALLDERAAGVSVEAVPVAHFWQKGSGAPGSRAS